MLAVFDCGLVVPYRAELEVVGEEGTLLVPDPWHVREPGLELRGQGGERRHVPSPRPTRTGSSSRTSPTLLGREDALGQAAALEALAEAAETVAAGVR